MECSATHDDLKVLVTVLVNILKCWIYWSSVIMPFFFFVVDLACSGFRSAWRPASCAVARRRCGWTPTRPMRLPTQIHVRCLFAQKDCSSVDLWSGLRRSSWTDDEFCLCHRPADPKTGEGWFDHQKTCDRSFACSLPQEHAGTPQGTSHGLWWVNDSN